MHLHTSIILHFSDKTLLSTIHCIGKADEMNPPASAHQLASVFATRNNNNNNNNNSENKCRDSDVVKLEHGGGHIFPQDEDSIGIYLDVLRRKGLH